MGLLLVHAVDSGHAVYTAWKSVHVFALVLFFFFSAWSVASSSVRALRERKPLEQVHHHALIPKCSHIMMCTEEVCACACCRHTGLALGMGLEGLASACNHVLPGLRVGPRCLFLLSQLREERVVLTALGS